MSLEYGKAKVIHNKEIIGECDIQSYDVRIAKYSGEDNSCSPNITVQIRKPDPKDIFDVYNLEKKYDLVIQSGTHIMKIPNCRVTKVENYENSFSNNPPELHITLTGDNLETIDGIDRAIDRLDD